MKFAQVERVHRVSTFINFKTWSVHHYFHLNFLKLNNDRKSLSNMNLINSLKICLNFKVNLELKDGRNSFSHSFLFPMPFNEMHCLFFFSSSQRGQHVGTGDELGLPRADPRIREAPGAGAGEAEEAAVGSSAQAERGCQATSHEQRCCEQAQERRGGQGPSFRVCLWTFPTQWLLLAFLRSKDYFSSLKIETEFGFPSWLSFHVGHSWNRRIAVPAGLIEDWVPRGLLELLTF